MMRRFLMRRSYNKGQWSQARTHANKIIHLPKEQDLARSVVIRSYFNEGLFAEVIHCNQKWGFEFEHLSEKAAYKLSLLNPTSQKIFDPRIKKLHASQPAPTHRDAEWDPVDLCDNFIQEKNRLWMRHPHGWTYWDMPEGYSLEKTHDALLILATEVLLRPWEPSTHLDSTVRRKTGERLALAYSGGTDSTAAVFTLPHDTILGYHRRNFESILDHRNAQRVMDHFEQNLGRVIVDIPSNHELIRTFYHKQIGFSTDMACASHLILLADYYGIGAIAFGMPLDNTWLMKGRKFRDFSESQYLKHWGQRFARAGLELVLPIAGLSEAGAMKICESEGILPYMNSCLRGNGMEGCGECWKCFHKNGPLGRPYDIEASEIQTFLNRRPLPTATHALWALKQMGHQSQAPDLQHHMEEDFSWWTCYYPPAKEILPERWKAGIIDKISKHLQDMTRPYVLESVNYFDE
jgi:hypothetical protein